MLGVFSAFDVAWGCCLVWDWCVCIHNFPRLLPVYLPIGRLAMAALQQNSQHKTYVWRFGGKPPLCWGFCCNADRTSLPSPACRGSCGLVLALATTSEDCSWPRLKVRDGRDHSSTNQRRVTRDVTSGWASRLARPFDQSPASLPVTSHADMAADWPRTRAASGVDKMDGSFKKL